MSTHWTTYGGSGAPQYSNNYYFVTTAMLNVVDAINDGQVIIITKSGNLLMSGLSFATTSWTATGK